MLFKAQMSTATLFLERDCFTIVVEDPSNPNLQHRHKHNHPEEQTAHYTHDVYRSHAYRMTFVGAKKAKVAGHERLDTYDNYYLGNDPKHWASEVRHYLKVSYTDLYNGIGLNVYSAENALKYDFVVAPKADPSQIVMRYDGIEKLILQNGNIAVRTSVADIIELKPYAYQIVDGRKVEIKAEYVLKGNTVRIQLGDYDKTRELVIDPFLIFSTYTGSKPDNWGTTAAYDSYKNTYSAGLVFGAQYPVSLGSYCGSYSGNSDIGIFKFDSLGTQRLYATYLGGSQADMPHSMFVNAFDELVIYGTTGSSNFPTSVTAYDRTFNGGTYIYYEGSEIPFPNGSDIFVCRFNSTGTQLQASTFIGGSGNDGLNFRHEYNSSGTLMLGNDSLYYNYGDGARGELITDDLNNIYVGTTTMSTDFPTTANCFQDSSGGRQDAIVFKLDYNLSHLMWSSYLGGSGDDAVYSIDVDTNYNLLVCGGTNSHDFPVTPGCYRPNYMGGSADGFVAKISYYGNELMASTFFGSYAYDQCYFVRTGKKNDVFLFGQTAASGNTMIYNAYYNRPNSGQFLARLKPNLDTLVWSTVFGSGRGTPDLSPTAFAADICNRVYAAGWGRVFAGYYLNGQTWAWNTWGTTGLPTTADAYQSTTDGQDFYIFSLAADASSIEYATFFGESHTTGGGNDHVDGGTSRFDRLATLYQAACASCGNTDHFPTTANAWSDSNRSTNCNNAVFRFSVAEDFPVAEFVAPSSGCVPYTVTFHNTGRGDSYAWDFGDGTTSTQANPSHTFSAPGTYRVRLIAYMTGGCRDADTMTREVMVLGNQAQWLDTLTSCSNMRLQIGITPQMGCTYFWSTGNVSDATIANPYVTQTGLYTLIVNSNGCADTMYQRVVEGHAEFTISGDTSDCSSPINVNINVSGNNVRYIWSNYSDFSDTINRDTLSGHLQQELNGPQWLYVQVKDALGCEARDSLYIDFYSILDTITFGDATCPNICNGTALVEPSRYAQNPIRYSWDGYQCQNPSDSSLCPGNHTITISDGAGCIVSKNFTISSPPMPLITDSVTHVKCLEWNTGAIDVFVTGNSTYSYLWLDDLSTSPSRDSLAPGVYIVEITDTLGCTFYDTIEVLDNADMRVSAQFLHNTCPNVCSGSASAQAFGGTIPYNYEWSDGERSSTAQGLCEGWNYITITDILGCKVKDSLYIDTQHSFDSIDAWADDSITFHGASTQLHVTPIPNGDYYWEPTDKLTGYRSTDPTATIDDSTTFYVTITDSIGCTYTDSVKVNCIFVNCGRPNIFIPNAFSPNGDGINDQLCFQGEWIKEFHISIFTRWGELVYQSDDINECWDGKYKGSFCLPGVYAFYCKIKCEANEDGESKGDITLIR